jgi:hypothetical protein
MEAAHHQPDAEHSPSLYVVPGIECRVQDELAAQFDTAVAFADFCTFLTSGRVGDQADQLIKLSQFLLAETTAELERRRTCRSESAAPGRPVPDGHLRLRRQH